MEVQIGNYLEENNYGRK
nr:hypothetical protein [Clostridium ljungdahlii]